MKSENNRQLLNGLVPVLCIVSECLLGSLALSILINSLLITLFLRHRIREFHFFSIVVLQV